MTRPKNPRCWYSLGPVQRTVAFRWRWNDCSHVFKHFLEIQRMNSTLGRWHSWLIVFCDGFSTTNNICVFICDSNSDFEITSRYRDQRCETWIIICNRNHGWTKSKTRSYPFGTFPPWLPWQPSEHDVHLLCKKKRKTPKTFGCWRDPFSTEQLALLEEGSHQIQTSAPNLSWETHFSPWLF